jgi:hypothetical protein
MRDDNKVSRQHIYATARSSMTTIRATTRMFGIVYIDGLLHLLCANHPSIDKPKGEPMIPMIAMSWIHLVLVLVHLNIYEICLRLKSVFRIIHKFLTQVPPPVHVGYK